MATIRVVVNGAMGKMGQEVMQALAKEKDIAVVGGVDLKPGDASVDLGNGVSLTVSPSLEQTIMGTRPNVVVDFTNVEGAKACAMIASHHGVHTVVGSSGITEAVLRDLETLANEYKVGILVVPNFAMGAVVLEYLAKMAAPFFDYVEIVEAHHEQKIDSPSGTALSIARSIKSKSPPLKHNNPTKEPLPGGRGANFEGIAIHSMRMPGRLAHHEIVFGAQGQTLTLRHDSLNRECYMPGVVRAVREVVQSKGLTVGLERVLGLSK